MEAIAKLSTDLILAIMCLIISAGNDGKLHDVAISEDGPVDQGIIVVEKGVWSFYDGQDIDANSKVMTLTPTGKKAAGYTYAHKVEKGTEIDLDVLVPNRKEFDGKAEEFTFRLKDGTEVLFFRVNDVKYLHVMGTSLTLVVHK